MIAKEKKQAIIAEYGLKEGDTGSPEVQVAILTARIQELTAHLQAIPVTATQASVSAAKTPPRAISRAVSSLTGPYFLSVFLLTSSAFLLDLFV